MGGFGLLPNQLHFFKEAFSLGQLTVILCGFNGEESLLICLHDFEFGKIPMNKGLQAQLLDISYVRKGRRRD